MRHGGWRKRRVSMCSLLVISVIVTGFGLLLLKFRSVELTTTVGGFVSRLEPQFIDSSSSSRAGHQITRGEKSCATVNEMGNEFNGGFEKESLRVRQLIRRHFALNGAPSIRKLPPEQFCLHNFVLGKASEAGFGNEMYKMLTGAALSIMLNRSLIIGQTRGKYPFGDYIAYSNLTFTLREVKRLWRQNDCLTRFGRHLTMRIDDFEKPAKTNVLCSNWRAWEEPIIWFQGTTDAVAAQFFLKNVYPEMSSTASELFGHPGSLRSRPNVFGELMRSLISPSKDVMEAVNWVLDGREDPDISVHMRMLMNRSLRAVQAVLSCLTKIMNKLEKPRHRVALVSDTPSLVRGMHPNISEFAEVIHFDYKAFKGNNFRDVSRPPSLEFRNKDWGPAPRWVAFVDFFLASRAKHAVISGAHRRIATTYAQLVAALAAANSLGDNSTASNFSFISSIHSNLLTEGLKVQVGWGHVWNRYAGPLSCSNQTNQCAFTPLLPPAWWDGLWQSPIARDTRRLSMFGIELSGLGTVDEASLFSFCSSKKETVNTVILV